MIKNFSHKGLQELFNTGRSSKIGKKYQNRAVRRLDSLEFATKPEEMDIPGFDFHSLTGKPERYSVHVNGNYCITFGWEGRNAINVDFEDYH